MRVIKTFLLSIFLISLISVSCAQNVADHTIDVDSLRQKMKTDTSFVLLDVRTPSELTTPPLGHIDGGMNIPVQQLEQRVNELEPYKDKEIVVICRSGHRSSIATGILLKHGFNATNVAGGMLRYRATEKEKSVKKQTAE